MNTSEPSKHARVISKSDEDMAAMREFFMVQDKDRADALIAACEIAKSLEASKHFPLSVVGHAARSVLVTIVSESLERNGKDGAK